MWGHFLMLNDHGPCLTQHRLTKQKSVDTYRHPGLNESKIWLQISDFHLLFISSYKIEPFKGKNIFVGQCLTVIQWIKKPISP